VETADLAYPRYQISKGETSGPAHIRLEPTIEERRVNGGARRPSMTQERARGRFLGLQRVILGVATEVLTLLTQLTLATEYIRVKP
jgi:hypothetical protein